MERVRENKEAIAQLEPKAHELETKINDAVAVLADAIPQWRSVVSKINQAHGTCHSLLPDEYAKHRYSSDSIEELKLPTIKLYSHSSFTVQIARTKI
ncbi:MAG: hypothetical protein F6K35_29165 [Okeania sp. SIO2H7]|nr:hypothetical protein [Okeania sp. SIO2H7]